MLWIIIVWWWEGGSPTFTNYAIKFGSIEVTPHWSGGKYDLFRLLLVVKQNVDIYERNDYSRGICIILTYFLYNISYVSNPSIQSEVSHRHCRNPKNTNVVEGMVKALARVVSSVQARYYSLSSVAILFSCLSKWVHTSLFVQLEMDSLCL